MAKDTILSHYKNKNELYKKQNKKKSLKMKHILLKKRKKKTKSSCFLIKILKIRLWHQ